MAGHLNCVAWVLVLVPTRASTREMARQAAGVAVEKVAEQRVIVAVVVLAEMVMAVVLELVAVVFDVALVHGARVLVALAGVRDD